MELTRRLLGWGYRRPHVLLARTPGAGGAWRAAERELWVRGWPQAVSPAAADVLLVCGRPGPQLQEQVDRVWDQLPGPRALAVVERPADAGAELERARALLQDLGAQRKDARGRTGDAAADEDGPEGADGMSGDEGDAMSMPAGLPMAGTGPDRDGLQLDELHVQLGPVLPHWPAGILAELGLQGDVVTTATLRLLDDEPAVDAEPPQVLRLDRAAATLALAGVRRHAHSARALRDRVAVGELVDSDLVRLRRAVERDRVLRWSLVGLPAVGADELWSQLLALLGPAGRPSPPVLAATAEAALTGSDVGAVRLVMAAAPPLQAGDRERAGA